MNDYYVYAMKEDTSSVPFYIGKGRGRRMYVHEQKAKMGIASNKNWKLFRKIRDILHNRKTIVYEKLGDNLSNEDALRLETIIIKLYGLNVLCNLNFGGTGRPEGYKHSTETKNKIKLSNIGKKRSSETRNRIGLSKRGNTYRKGATLSNETKRKISQSHIGKVGGRPVLEISGFISPCGIVFSPVKNLSQFCRHHGLTFALMHAVVRKKQTHHKGWKLWPTHPNQEKQKDENFNKK